MPRVPQSLEPERRAGDAGAPAQAGPRIRLVMTVAWSSFLVASAGTMVFFAFVDPTPVAALLTTLDVTPSRTALYSLGFLFLWLLCACAAALAAWLLSTPPAGETR